MKNNLLIHVPHSSLFIPEDYSEELIAGIEKICSALGLTTAINYPYAGSLVPNAYFGRQGTGIVSVMLEINKRVLAR